MFNNEDAKKKILVKILRHDGETLSGHLVLPVMANLSRTMNNDSKFLEFEDFSGTVRLIAKSAVVELKAEDLKPVDLKSPDVSGDAMDPYAILGLSRDAVWADVRKAYLDITKQYHPDQYSNVRLPEEVLHYMSARFSLANTAYNVIKSASADTKSEAAA